LYSLERMDDIRAEVFALIHLLTLIFLSLSFSKHRLTRCVASPAVQGGEG